MDAGLLRDARTVMFGEFASAVEPLLEARTAIRSVEGMADVAGTPQVAQSSAALHAGAGALRELAARYSSGAEPVLDAQRGKLLVRRADHLEHASQELGRIASLGIAADGEHLANYVGSSVGVARQDLSLLLGPEFGTAHPHAVPATVADPALRRVARTTNQLATALHSLQTSATDLPKLLIDGEHQVEPALRNAFWDVAGTAGVVAEGAHLSTEQQASAVAASNAARRTVLTEVASADAADAFLAAHGAALHELVTSARRAIRRD